MIEKKPIKKGKELIFDLTDRGFNVKAWNLNDISGNALVEITKNGKLHRKFKWPAYKIFNISAHFGDIVDGELEKTNDKLSGYKIAGRTF
jgi:hypothetical protein